MDVSSSMTRDIGLPNDAIESFRQTILEDPVATVRVETALVAFNHQTTVAHDFSSIDGFHRGPLTASGGTRVCPAVDHAQDLVEDRKTIYSANGVGYYRPMLFIPFTDGMTGGSEGLATTAARVRAPRPPRVSRPSPSCASTRAPPGMDQQLRRYGLLLRHRR